MKITALPDLPAASSIPTTNQPAIVEPVLTPAVTEPKPDGELSSKYAELAKREKALRNKVQAREEALKARESALQAKEAEYASSYVQKQKIQELFQRDPYQAMKDFGINGDQLTQGLLNQPSPENRMIQDLQAKVSELESKLGRTEGLFDERDKGAREQALNQIRFDIKSLVNNDPQYEVIKSTGPDAIEDILNRYEKKFDETGELASLEQIANEVEEEYAVALVKFTQLKKIQERVKPPEVKPAATAQKAPTKTLTHSQVSAAPRALSPRDRAIAMLEGSKI